MVICPAPDWEGFDKLIQFLKNEYAAVVLDRTDGPGARRWILKAEGQEFELIHDDGYGNYLLAPTHSSQAVVQRIGQDLQERLKNLPSP